MKKGRNEIDCRNLHLEGVSAVCLCPGGHIQKANSGHLLPEFGRSANYLANQFTLSCAGGVGFGIEQMANTLS
jgi:hypothetical protein